MFAWVTTTVVLGDKMLSFSWVSRTLNVEIETMTRYLFRHQTGIFFPGQARLGRVRGTGTRR
jgi:hypothetical protein